MNDASNKKSIPELLESLKKSATFTMSRGGRELFHTNFLAHILDIEDVYDELESVPDDLKYIINVKRNILRQLFDNPPKNVWAFRERASLDLVIVPVFKEIENHSEIIVIEAKIKAIPTSDQLIKYNQKFSNGINLELYESVDYESIDHNKNTKTYGITKIRFQLDEKKSTEYAARLYLLDETSKNKERCNPFQVKLKRYLLAPECTSKEISENPEWKLIEWKDFLSKIRPTKVEANNSLLKQLVEDYINSTNDILDLVNAVDEMTRLFTENNNSFKEFEKFSVNRSDFKRSRLHDLVGKVAYNQLRMRIISRIKNKYENLPGNFEFDSFTFYSRSIPGLVVQFKYEDKSDPKKTISLGVQLQGDDYRHFIERNNFPEDSPELITCATRIKTWMCSIGVTKEIGDGSRNNGFKVFDSSKFVYLGTKLDSFTFEDLIKKLDDSLNGAIDEIKKQTFLNCELEVKSS